MFTFLLAILILDALLLTTVVLLQAGQGGGLAALGGASSTDSFVGGRQAVTILTKMSWWCGGIFLALSLVLAGISTRTGQPQSVLEGQFAPPAPVTPLPLDLDQGGAETPGAGEAQPAQPSGAEDEPPPSNPEP